MIPTRSSCKVTASHIVADQYQQIVYQPVWSDHSKMADLLVFADIFLSN